MIRDFFSYIHFFIIIGQQNANARQCIASVARFTLEMSFICMLHMYYVLLLFFRWLYFLFLISFTDCGCEHCEKWINERTTKIKQNTNRTNIHIGLSMRFYRWTLNNNQKRQVTTIKDQPHIAHGIFWPCASCYEIYELEHLKHNHCVTQFSLPTERKQFVTLHANSTGNKQIKSSFVWWCAI